MGKNKLDLIGQVFGYWTVIKEVDKNKHGQTQWLCRCKCGNEGIVTTIALRSGRSKSCGCYKIQMSTNDLKGRQFGRLTPIKIVGKNQRANVWECKCSCGNTVNVKSTSLMNGTTTSCGCKLKEYQENRTVDFTGNETSDISVLAKLKTNKAGSVIYQCRCKHCGNIFECTDHALQQGCVHSCGCTYGSKLENEIADFIKDLVPNIKMYRSYKISSDIKQEFDIYLPDYALAIEVNGSFIHSTEGNIFNPKDKKYHQNKFLLAKSQGIRLINIFDVFWGDKVKNMLKEIFLPKKKIFARKCSCELIDKYIANRFFEEYHLQGGNRNSRWHYGLYYNNELLSVMSFGIKRFGTDVEIIRYAVKTGYMILGGAEKLFKHFLADTDVDSVFTYSDNNYFTGNVYKKLGFKEVGITSPDYYWYNCKQGYLSREKCQPRLLKKKYLELYDAHAKSVEADIMLKLGFCRVYMCGNTSWKFS